MAETILLYPSAGMGHLISMVELANLILHHYPSIKITILLTQSPFAAATAPYIASVSSAVPSIAFHRLPPIPLDPSAYASVEDLMVHLLKLNNTHVDAVLRSSAATSSVKCLVIDFFCFPAMEITAELGIPVYNFFTSGAGCLSIFLHLPYFHKITTQNFKDSDLPFDFPGLPPMPLNHMPEPALVKGNDVYDFFIDATAHLSRTAGILINTFEMLEPEPVKVLSNGLQIPDCPRTPPIFCIGPLIATRFNDGDKEAECLKWLDSQPKQSVVYLCFGSMGLFSKEQLMEIAIGLERSGQRFLWVVRDPPEKRQAKGFLSGRPDPSLETLLPEGFLTRTRDRGFVAKTWVPQVSVLSHNSVGGFVTHCGWNSVLEAVRAGKPMAAWPLYAEQKINKVILTEALKLAVAVEVELSESGLVSREEVEKRVRELMESGESVRLKARALAKKEEAVAALSEEDGLSHVALRRFIDSLIE